MIIAKFNRQTIRNKKQEVEKTAKNVVCVRNKSSKFAFIARIRKFMEVQELRNKKCKNYYARTVALQLLLHRLLLTQLLLLPHLLSLASRRSQRNQLFTPTPPRRPRRQGI